ncbi:glycogen synthesis protein GlgS [Leminorella grimontii]|uniref:glycogen synthesis protein GlgS n=1 Tax=Leminorella grimontii TaxID=82981 RepID=UPI0021C37AF7|nr:glycogen synthesis protein GlgS [Leminorella grimontii]
METQNLQSVKNFDFLARCLAQMYAQGRPVNVQAVIGNMNEEQKAWFQKRYNSYLKQAKRARVTGMDS